MRTQDGTFLYYKLVMCRKELKTLRTRRSFQRFFDTQYRIIFIFFINERKNLILNLK